MPVVSYPREFFQGAAPILDHAAVDARCVVPGRRTGRLARHGARRPGCLGRRPWCHGARRSGCSGPGSMRDGGRHPGCLARYRDFFATRAVLDFHALTWPRGSVRGGRLGCLGRRPRRLTVEPPRSPRRTGRIWRAAAPAPRQDNDGGGQYRDDPPHLSPNAPPGGRLRSVFGLTSAGPRAARSSTSIPPDRARSSGTAIGEACPSQSAAG
jgi:hypothetical protein